MSAAEHEVQCEPVLSVRSLSKRWKSEFVLQDISFDVYPSDILTILGPNGSGKSTLLSILSTAQASDTGEVKYLGESSTKLRTIRANLGYMPDLEQVPDEFTVLDYLTFYSRAYEMSRRMAKTAIREALSSPYLVNEEEQLIRQLSPIQWRHLSFSRALLHQPKLLLLDEPLSGLASEERNTVADRIRSYASRAGAVVLSSLDFDEVASVATRMSVMDLGRIRKTGSPEEILDTLKEEENKSE